MRALDTTSYTQIGLIMLVGLAARTRSSSWKFRQAEARAGESIVQAALDGAK